MTTLQPAVRRPAATAHPSALGTNTGLGVRRAMLVSDPGIVRAGITERVRQSIEAAGIACVVYDHVRVEPTVQKELARAGVPMVWFDDLGSEHPAFAAIQLAALRGVYPMEAPDLHAAPEAPARYQM